MISTKRLEPGKWYVEYDEKGNLINMVHDAAYCHILGYASEKEYNESGLSWIDTIHPDDMQRVDTLMKKVKRKHPKGMDFDIEYRRMTRYGYRWFHDFGRCVRRNDGSLLCIDGVIFDIQETVDREDAHQALIDNNMRILALEDRFESLYDVDLETGRYEMYIKGQTLGDINSRMVNCNDFFADTLENIDRVVYYDDRDGVRSILSAESIRKNLDQYRYFDWYYRLLVETGNVWVRTRILYKNAERKHIIVGVFNAEEEMNLRRQEEHRRMELEISRFRTETLAYVADHDPDPVKFMDYFGNEFLQLSGCDQVVFRNTDGHRYVLNAPGIEDTPQEICDNCPFSGMNSDLYAEDGYILMDDCFVGREGVLTHPDCPAKSSFMQQIWSDGKLMGLLSVHYLKERHTFVDVEIDMMKDVASYMGLLIGRIYAKQMELEKLEAESANRAKTEFLFNMSHDIRTPMNAVLGFTNMALKHIDEKETVRDCLNKTQQAGQMLLSLINSILDMSRIESGNTAVDEKPGDVYLSFANFDIIMKQMADSRGIDLSFEFGKIRDRYVYCDYTLCNRVFVNIISNSIKYTREGGYVKVKCEQIPGEKKGFGNYRYTVTDNGVGMSEEFLSHVFEQFTREHTTTNDVTQGTGLGMAVCKSFVEQMGGTVECRSKLGEGTSFIVTLPFRLQEGMEYTDPRTGMTVSGAASPETGIPDFTGRKALLAEDNDLNREIISDILTEEGLCVETAVDGRQAVDILKDRGPAYFDFILMDIQMPVMNGYEATGAIRALYPDAKIPIIAVSANAFEEDRQASLAAGMDDHVAKPVNVSELLSILSKYI